ncbi:MAG: GatB/YqeY domain-containing protein [Candidatus Peregrinibacteria bacterium]|nr:GatB/YqeY domain-containing protein [Candidatus Peregrinibacteria bacterium]MDZ4245232.1 GatB/YqeY domain-containing protein [Candidatus Gracilibacteria bacterium]
MLKDTIQSDMINAMKARDEVTVRTLRMVKASIMKYETSAENMVADDAKVIGILKKELKQRQDSIQQFEAGGREDLAISEREELAVLERYLPEEMPREQVIEVAKAVIAQFNATSKADFGKVMGPLMGKLNGQVDGSVVKEVLEELLS